MNNQALSIKSGIIRHAITFWNMEKKIQGQYDLPLAPLGEKMAKAWGRKLLPLKWDRIISSDLKRARQTANLINISLKIPINYDKKLREADWGDWTGKTIKEIRKNNKRLLKNMEKMGWDFRPPGGESRTEVWERANRALTDAALKYPQKKILIVTHNGVIKCLIYRILNRKFLPSEPFLIKNYHLHKLSVAENKIFISQINSIDLNPEAK